MAVTIVGCGPGAADHVTPAARHAVERAQVLAGARHLLDLFSHVAAERLVLGSDVAACVEGIAARSAEGRTVAVLVSGDPGLCSLAEPVMRRLGRGNCSVVAGVSSLQVAFARLGLDWRNARVVNAHGSTPDVDSTGLGSGGGPLAVLLGGRDGLEWLLGAWRELPHRRLFLLEDLTLETERVREVRLGASLDAVSSRAIAILVEGSALE